jgi:hypothetical protein
MDTAPVIAISRTPRFECPAARADRQPTAVHFAVESFSHAYAEAGPLMEAHWQEIAKNKDLLKLNPDVACYQAIEQNNKMLLVTARCETRLVGYFLWLLVTHAHYKHVLVAEEDLHFMLPEFRRGLTGYSFIKAACKAATDAGAKLLIMREKIGHEHQALMKRLKFKPTDIVYTYAVGG